MPAPASPVPDTDATPDLGVLKWLVGATFIVILNETIMMNAIPSLMREFDVTENAAQWLSTAFMLTMAVVIPITGWFLQQVTTRRAFALAMGVFSTGTLLAAVAPTFGVLLAGRVVQASGTAVMMPLLMTTLMTIVPARDRGRVMGNVTLAMSVAPALGPAVSGVILHVAGWRWMFGLVLPLALLILVVGLRKLSDVGQVVPGRLDVPSVLASALGFGTLVYGISEIGVREDRLLPAALIGLGVLLIVTFVVRQLVLQRSGAPLLDLRTLRHRTYTLALVMMALAFMGMLGSMILLPLYLQNVRGISELKTGLLLMPGGLAMGLLGPGVGRVFDKVGGRPLVIPGSVGIVVALVLLTKLGTTTSIWVVLAAHVLMMVCLAAVFTPVFTLGLGAVPPQLYSHASSLLGTLQQVAGALGTALVITVMTTHATSLAEDGTAPLDAAVGGMQWAFAVGAGISVLVLVVAVLLPGRLPAGVGHGHDGAPDDQPELDPLGA
jgi:DHA2 family lincomycin resistance protein-like MFS transporter